MLGQKGHKLMNNEAKTMTSGQSLQLMAVIAQSLGKIGLDFDSAKDLIDRPHITRKRLKALKDETPIVVPQHQYATIEQVGVDNAGHWKYDTVKEFVRLSDGIKEILEKPQETDNYDDWRNRKINAFRCDIIRKPDSLVPVFREALCHAGPDACIWNLLYERRALWTVTEVLGFIYREVNDDQDPLGLRDFKSEFNGGGAPMFPVLLSTKNKSTWRNIYEPEADQVGLIVVNQGLFLRKQRTWDVRLESSGNIEDRKNWTEGNRFKRTIYFANDPRVPAKE
jgi:hypothetical protein